MLRLSELQITSKLSEMKVLATPFILALAVLTWGQSAHPKRQISSSMTKPTKRPLSPKESTWCKILESALNGAEAAEDLQVRSYLLESVAGGLEKCEPQNVRRVLIDSFTATLAIPEHEEEFGESRRKFYSQHRQPDQAAQETLFKLQMKQMLQSSALRHLVNVDETKIDSLISQAEPEIRSELLKEVISQATHAKKFDRALALLRQTPSKEWLPIGFPYDEATLLMVGLPPERDVEKQEVFRLAMAADRERHSLPNGTEDFASMIVRFWRQVPAGVALEAIHQVLDKAHFEMEGATFNASSVNARFSNEHEYRAFELLPVLRQLDSESADKLLQSAQEAQLQLQQFPDGIQSIDPSTEVLSASKKAPVTMLGGSIGMSGNGSPETDEINAMYQRVYEIGRISEDNPRQALAVAATLPESVGPDWGKEFPRALAYLGIARTLNKKNTPVATNALQEMADSLKPAAHAYGATDHWIEAIGIAREMEDKDLALDLIEAGMKHADRLRSEDADPDDPNTAIKPLWPSACAYTRLILTASQISSETAILRVHEVTDPEIALLLEIRLASKELGTKQISFQTIVHKKSFGRFGGCAGDSTN